MMRVAVLCVFVVSLCVYITSVEGHAKLNNPTAWNPNPSKTLQCGGSKDPGVVADIWMLGGNEPFEWEVVVGDGIGPVSIKASKYPGVTNFTVASAYDDIPVAPNNPNALGKFTITAKVPASLSCISTKGCPVQFKSSSGWVACATIAFQSGSTTAGASSSSSSSGSSPNTVSSSGTVIKPQPKPMCKRANTSDVPFCSMLVGKNMSYPTTSALHVIDASARDSYNFNLANELVFFKSVTPGCLSAYYEFICAFTFRPCGVSEYKPCQSVCEAVLRKCAITFMHQYLYNCTSAVTSDLVNACQSRSESFYTASTDANSPVLDGTPTNTVDTTVSNGASVNSYSSLVMLFLIIVLIFIS